MDENRGSTGAGKTNGVGRAGLGVNDRELEGAGDGEEVAENPLNGVVAVLAVVDPHHHHHRSLLSGGCHCWSSSRELQNRKQAKDIWKEKETGKMRKMG